MTILPELMSKARLILHSIIERDAQTMQYGTSSFTVQVDKKGDPIIKTLKITSAKRIKYGK